MKFSEGHAEVILLIGNITIVATSSKILKKFVQDSNISALFYLFLT